MLCRAADGLFPVQVSMENVGELLGEVEGLGCCRGGNLLEVALADFSLSAEIWKRELEI